MLKMGLFALAAIVVPVTTAIAQDDRPVKFYNVSTDPNSLTLLDLSNIRSERGRELMTVVDMFRGRIKHGMVATWAINCPKRQLGIIKLMTFDPRGNSIGKPVNGEIVGPRNVQTRTMYQLACTGEGDLSGSRVFRDELPVIVRRFWSR